MAQAGQRLSGRTADAVVDVSAATADAVEDAGTATAEVIEDAGDEAATATRKATGSAGPDRECADRATPTNAPASSPESTGRPRCRGMTAVGRAT